MDRVSWLLNSHPWATLTWIPEKPTKPPPPGLTSSHLTSRSSKTFLPSCRRLYYLHGRPFTEGALSVRIWEMRSHASLPRKTDRKSLSTPRASSDDDDDLSLLPSLIDNFFVRRRGFSTSRTHRCLVEGGGGSFYSGMMKTVPFLLLPPLPASAALM